MQQYIYYRYNGAQPAEFPINEQYILKKRKPALCNVYNIVATLFSKLHSVEFLEYSYEHKGKLISRACIMGRLPVFRFMPSNGIHIGHAWTSPDYRGQNLYPSLLGNIIRDYTTQQQPRNIHTYIHTYIHTHIHTQDKNPDTRPIYVFTADTNIASQHGILKTKVLEPVATGYKKYRCYWLDSHR